MFRTESLLRRRSRFILILLAIPCLILVGSVALAHPVRQSQQASDSEAVVADQAPQAAVDESSGAADTTSMGQTQPTTQADEPSTDQDQPAVTPNGQASGQPAVGQLTVVTSQTGHTPGQVSRPVYDGAMPIGYPNGAAEQLRQATAAETNPNAPRVTPLSAPTPSGPPLTP
jgi:hypothetical protein